MAKSETRRSTSDTVTSTRRLELFSTLTELVRARASEPATKDEPIISYPSSGTSYVDFTPAQIDRLADKAAFYYESFIYRRISSDEPVQVVALLGPSTFAYFITLLALSRLGHSVLLLSTRLPLEAHVSLLQTTRSTVLLVDEAYADTSEDAQRQIPNLILGVLGTLKDFNRMENETAGSESQLDPARESGHIAYIIHSSGSTSLNRAVATWSGSCSGPFPAVVHAVLERHKVGDASGSLAGWLSDDCLHKEGGYMHAVLREFEKVISQRLVRVLG
ncbi:hypothetical protein LTR56_024970 [Elasticomyces elasticus]|nr:hypothetical protein LTR56_024970 [Elasticomyces elasticus]